MNEYRHVVGIALSLTSTGIATHYPDGSIITSAFGRDGHRTDTIADRRQHIADTVAELRRYAHRDTLVVVEGPSMGQRRQGGEHDRAGLWWAIVAMLIDVDVDVAICPPSVRAKWITGNGRADKNAVMAAAAERFGRRFRKSDEADAAILAGIGAHALGWRTDSQHRLLCSVEWPTVVAELVAAPYHRPATDGVL